MSMGGGAAAPDTSSEMQQVMQQARATHVQGEDAKSTCSKCGGVGHFAFQCRNHLDKKAQVVAVDSTSSESSSGSESESSESDASHGSFSGSERGRRRKDKKAAASFGREAFGGGGGKDAAYSNPWLNASRTMDPKSMRMRSNQA